MEQHYVALDMGSSNGKIVSAYLDKEKKLIMREVGRFPTPRIWINGHVRTDIYGVYKEVCNALSRLSINGMKIKSFGADSWSSDFGLITPEGELLGLPIFYRDKWTDGIPEEVEKFINYQELYTLTTQRRMRDATLCQLLALKKESPELLNNGNKLMCLGDILMYFFSGKVCSEISVASYSQLFSMKNMCWENQVFDLFGIPKGIQPRIVHAGEYLGKISAEQARVLGVNCFEVIAPPVHDTAAAGVAVPAKKEENWAYLATGSWYLVSMEIDKPADLFLSYRYNLSNTGLAFGNTLLKRNVCAMWLIQECRRSWLKSRPDCDYQMITALASHAKPFAGMIDPDDSCFYNPDDMVDAVLQYLEQTGQWVPNKEEIGQIARIIYESITFKCKYSMETLKKATGKKVEKLYVVGGASGIAFLNQMLATALHLPIITGPEEASATGNVLLQAFGMGDIKSEEEAREIVRRSFERNVFYPQTEERWEQKYLEFLQMCDLNDIRSQECI